MEDNFGSEDLEDGEQWLPPDFFSVEEVQISNKKTTPFNHRSSSKPPSMEVLQHSSSSNLLQRRFPNVGLPLSNVQPFKPPVWYFPSRGSGGGAYDPQLNPVQTQVESSMGAVMYQSFRGVAMSPRGGTGVFLPAVDEYQRIRQRGNGWRKNSSHEFLQLPPTPNRIRREEYGRWNSAASTFYSHPK